MKRCRISTLMLLVVIAALVLALIVQQDRYNRLVAETQKAADLAVLQILQATISRANSSDKVVRFRQAVSHYSF
jgi:hypothetical protein